MSIAVKDEPMIPMRVSGSSSSAQWQAICRVASLARRIGAKCPVAKHHLVEIAPFRGRACLHEGHIHTALRRSHVDDAMPGQEGDRCLRVPRVPMPARGPASKTVMSKHSVAAEVESIRLLSV
jgi:hypothetical protein